MSSGRASPSWVLITEREAALSRKGQRSGTKDSLQYVFRAETMWHLLPQRWRPLRNYQLWLLINTTTWERDLFWRGRASLAGGRPALHQMAPFCTLAFWVTLWAYLPVSVGGGGAALKSWWWVLRFCPSVFFLKAAALLHRQSEFRVEEGTQKG